MAIAYGHALERTQERQRRKIKAGPTPEAHDDAVALQRLANGRFEPAWLCEAQCVRHLSRPRR
eukprot:4849307-Prymnesium_polylepis.1